MTTSPSAASNTRSVCSAIRRASGAQSGVEERLSAARLLLRESRPSRRSAAAPSPWPLRPPERMCPPGTSRRAGRFAWLHCISMRRDYSGAAGGRAACSWSRITCDCLWYYFAAMDRFRAKHIPSFALAEASRRLGRTCLQPVVDLESRSCSCLRAAGLRPVGKAWATIRSVSCGKSSRRV